MARQTGSKPKSSLVVDGVNFQDDLGLTKAQAALFERMTPYNDPDNNKTYWKGDYVGTDAAFNTTTFADFPEGCEIYDAYSHKYNKKEAAGWKTQANAMT